MIIDTSCLHKYININTAKRRLAYWRLDRTILYKAKWRLANWRLYTINICTAKGRPDKRATVAKMPVANLQGIHTFIRIDLYIFNDILYNV